MRRRVRGVIIVVVAVAAGGLGFVFWMRRHKDVVIHPLSTKNPTSYTFDAELSSVRKCLLGDQCANGICSIQLPGRRLMEITTHGAPSYKIVDDGGTGGAEIVFVDGGSEPIGPSDIAFRGACPVPLVASFVVTIEPTSAGRTRVRVDMTESKVLVDTRFIIGHAWRKNIYQDIEPSTVDEYRILRHVGICLGDSTMPPIQAPLRPARCP